MPIINMVISGVMITSIVLLILDAMSSQDHHEKSHLKILSILAIVTSWFLIIFAIINNHQAIIKNNINYITIISSLFLITNTIAAIFIGKKTKIKHKKLYFLSLSLLVLSLININATSLIIKMISNIGWLMVITTISINDIDNSIKAEIGLKMLYAIIITLIFFMIGILFIAYGTLSFDLKDIANTPINHVTALGLCILWLASLAISGIPPFHFAYIDYVETSKPEIAFLFLSNAFIQGSLLFFYIEKILAKSIIIGNNISNLSAFLLGLGFIILWIRAIDQNKIIRMSSYIALSVGPLFYLSILFGSTILLPKAIFIIAMYAFITLTLFTLYGSFTYMDGVSLNHQTWEDLAGFGKINTWQSLTYLVALASIAGIPGTFGYFVKLSLIAPLKDNIFVSGSIFLSIAVGAACCMRIFVFSFAKQGEYSVKINNHKPYIIIIATAAILIALGFFPFVH